MLHWIIGEDAAGFKRWQRWVECSHWGLFFTGDQPHWVYPNYFDRANPRS